MKKIAIFIVIAGTVFFSCKKNDSGKGQPVITQVRAVDSTKRDSTFMQARPGDLIVIQGNNLSDVQAVYFNDTSAFFNPAYNTNTSVIINVPSTAQTMATDPKVPSTIRLVTNHGTAIYSFKLYLEPPYINSISFDNSGTLVYINGGNFQGIQKITFPVPGSDTALSYTVNKEFTQIVAAIPPGIASKDSIRVFATFGVGAYSYPPPMSITSVSNENGTAGATLTINGTNFIGITDVIFPGNIPGTNLTPISVSQMSVTVPAGITQPDSLRIVGGLGTAASPQLFDSYITHPSPGYLCTFDNQYGSDNTGFVGWTGGYADAATTTTQYPGGTGASGVLLQGSSMSANAGPTSQGNAGIIQLSDLPWVSNVNQSISNYALKFEVYVKSAWSMGEIWISIGDWYTWQDVGTFKNYTARYAPWESAPGNKYQPMGWQTVTIPLSQLITGNQFYQKSWNSAGNPANTFADYQTTGLAFFIANDQAKVVPTGSINIAIDNVRIVKFQ